MITKNTFWNITRFFESVVLLLGQNLHWQQQNMLQ
jgi:hypothetical protein